MKEYLILFFLLLGLCSCSEGWKKDAFEDESEAVKKAVPFGKHKKKIPPPDKDVIFMDFEPVYSVSEGEVLKIPVKYTIGHPEVIFQSLDVQGDFSKLSYDEETKTILINPTEETVDISAEYLLKDLQVSLFANYEGVVIGSVAKIKIMILPEANSRGFRPKIFKIIDFPEKIVPGLEAEFKVYVWGSTAQPPRLEIYSESGVAKYFSVNHDKDNPLVVFNDPEIIKECDCPFETVADDKYSDIWRFVVKLKVPKNAIIDEYKVRFMAYSIYGVPSEITDSPEKSFNVIFKKVPEPELN